MKNTSEEGFSVKWLVVFIAILLVAFLSVAVVAVSRRSTPAPVDSGTGQPSEKITDMAPSLPNNQKTAVVVMHSDSSYEKFLVPNTTVDSYANSLPTGDKIISKTPLSN